MQFFVVDTRTGARLPTAAALFMFALDNFGNIDRCRETSPHAVIGHNVAVGQIEAAGRLRGVHLVQMLTPEEVASATPEELDLLNQALETAAVAAGTVGSIVREVLARANPPWLGASLRELKKGAADHGVAPAAGGRTYEDVQRDLVRADPKGLWLTEVRRARARGEQ